MPRKVLTAIITAANRRSWLSVPFPRVWSIALPSNRGMNIADAVVPNNAKKAVAMYHLWWNPYLESRKSIFIGDIANEAYG